MSRLVDTSASPVVPTASDFAKRTESAKSVGQAVSLRRIVNPPTPAGRSTPSSKGKTFMAEAGTQESLVRFGIRGLDDLLLGGVPRHNVILVKGSVGSGKTLLGVEFIYRGITEFNEPGIIVV